MMVAIQAGGLYCELTIPQVIILDPPPQCLRPIGNLS